MLFSERALTRCDFTCDGVEEHEILKVGDLSPLPALSHVGGLEELTRGGQGNPPETHAHAVKKPLHLKTSEELAD